MKKISEFLNLKKRNVPFFVFRLIDNEIKVFLLNSFVLNFKINGRLREIYKLPQTINSEPIIIDDSLLFLDKKNKLIILN